MFLDVEGEGKVFGCLEAKRTFFTPCVKDTKLEGGRGGETGGRGEKGGEKEKRKMKEWERERFWENKNKETPFRKRTCPKAQ